jgi:type I restriction enzyme M protein
VWDEETTEAAELFGDADPVDFPEVHRFSVPDGCHWRNVREAPTNIGAALSRALREIERANPDTLYRVFGAADWGNREMLTDEILKDLVEGLSEVSLGNSAVGSDILGDAYEYLIGKLADITKRKKAFTTPPPAPAACCSARSSTSSARAATRVRSSARSTGRRRTSPPRPSHA